MNEATQPDWRQQCQLLGLDPLEVKKVSSRYDMYKNYTEKQTGEFLALERWYKWYRIEKLSEGHASRTPPADGCSVGPDSDGDAEPVISEAAFLTLLKLFRN